MKRISLFYKIYFIVIGVFALLLWLCNIKKQ